MFKGRTPLRSVSDLLDSTIGSIKLSILVFGPQVHTVSPDERTRNLQNKRKEIRNSLEMLGHKVNYAEDLVDPSLPGIAGNPMLQELVIMSEYDLIVTLVGSPGSIVEASMIAQKPNLARKTSLYLDEDHIDGLVGQACRMAQTMGAHFKTYKYPTDLVDCNLLGYVSSRVSEFQTMKYLL
jgi:hypothetical protein